MRAKRDATSTAPLKRRRWTEAEIVVALSDEWTVTEAAIRLRRTYSAVVQIRGKYRAATP